MGLIQRRHRIRPAHSIRWSNTSPLSTPAAPPPRRPPAGRQRTSCEFVRQMAAVQLRLLSIAGTGGERARRCWGGGAAGGDIAAHHQTSYSRTYSRHDTLYRTGAHLTTFPAAAARGAVGGGPTPTSTYLCIETTRYTLWHTLLDTAADTE